VLGEAGQDYASPKKQRGQLVKILLILIAAIVLLDSSGRWIGRATAETPCRIALCFVSHDAGKLFP